MMETTHYSWWRGRESRPRRKIAGGVGLLAIVLSMLVAAATPAQAAAPLSPWDTTWNTTALQFSGFNPGNASWWSQELCGNTTGFNCTNYVAYRLASNGVSDFLDGCGQTTHGGNAHTWNDKAALCGIRIDKVASPGSVIVFEGGAPTPIGGKYTVDGHVAYVDYVDGDSVYISEASCGNKQGHRATWSAQALASMSGVSIIHPGDISSGVGAGPVEPSRAFVLSGAGTLAAYGPEATFAITLGGSISAFDVSGSRAIAVVAGDVRVKAVDLESPWQSISWTGVPPIDVAIDGERILVLDQNHDLWARDSLLSGSWTLVTSQVDKFAADNGRIGVLKSGTVTVKEGALTAAWVTLTTGATDFAISGTRVAVLSGSTLNMKDGALTAPWVTIHNAVTDFSISNSRLLVRSGATLVAKEGALTAAWVTLSSNIVDFSVSDSVIVVEDASGVVSAKFGDVNAAWKTYTDTTSPVEVGTPH